MRLPYWTEAQYVYVQYPHLREDELWVLGIERFGAPIAWFAKEYPDAEWGPRIPEPGELAELGDIEECRQTVLKAYGWQDKAEPPAMSVPTEPGYYWCKLAHDSEWAIAQVFTLDGQWLANTGTWEVLTRHVSAWGERIPSSERLAAMRAVVDAALADPDDYTCADDCPLCRGIAAYKETEP